MRWYRGARRDELTQVKVSRKQPRWRLGVAGVEVVVIEVVVIEVRVIEASDGKQVFRAPLCPSRTTATRTSLRRLEISRRRLEN